VPNGIGATEGVHGVQCPRANRSGAQTNRCGEERGRALFKSLHMGPLQPCYVSGRAQRHPVTQTLIMVLGEQPPSQSQRRGSTRKKWGTGYRPDWVPFVFSSFPFPFPSLFCP